MSSKIVTQAAQLAKAGANENKAVKSAVERALDYVSKAPRIQIHDIKDNPGARIPSGQVTKGHNQAGHTVGELERAAKPPLGWTWGNFYSPWQRLFVGDRHFNGDVNIRREYTPLSLLELQRMIDLGYLDTTKLIDVTTLCATKLLEVKPEWRQFGIMLSDEGSEIFASKINLEVQWASLTCIAAVEKAGGRIRTAYYDLNSLKAAVDPMKWFSSGQPIPPRKFPPHSLMDYYRNPNYRGYLSEEESISKSAQRLAEIVGYEWEQSSEVNQEQKKPSQVFLGIESGSVVSLADQKVLEPTHPSLVDYYRPEEPLADHMR